ncbi:MAG TPA: hypothetical protein VES67_23765 [Vicinamibacterales bacterium]|nr:hypothetical protein [Vicinamibacterales bacterium]
MNAGPEVVVSISAALPSDDASARFRELQQHVVGLIDPNRR